MDDGNDPPASQDSDAAAARNESAIDELEELVDPSLYRLTEGLPKHELSIMLSEAKACEAELLEEIRLLEEALKEEEEEEEEEEEKSKATAPNTAATKISKEPSDNMATSVVTKSSPVEIMLSSEITPPDRYPTVSALLGRLREPIATPLPPNSYLLEIRQQQQQQLVSANKKKILGTSTPTPEQLMEYDRRERNQMIAKQQKLLQLSAHAEYRREHADSAALLALWKKISSHRTAAVFRRPVNPKEGKYYNIYKRSTTRVYDSCMSRIFLLSHLVMLITFVLFLAPGYTDRILFPIDLSLIRKMIVARMIKSYAELHQRIGLICHNCVKVSKRQVVCKPTNFCFVR